MKPVEVIRYYSQASMGSFPDAVENLEECQARHPDREYTILQNTRGFYPKFQVVQVKRERFDVLEEGTDFKFPPKPERRDYPAVTDHYYEDLVEWKKELELKRFGGRDWRRVFKTKLNP